jgi:segregation and condensation protein B
MDFTFADQSPDERPESQESVETALAEELAPPSEAASGGELDRPDPMQTTPQWHEERELRALLEALLFVSHEPLSAERLVMVLGEVKKAEVVRALHQLREELDREGRGLQLVEVAGGYQLRTRPDYSSWIKRLEKTKAAPKLSRSALESLAIIAYRQPVTRAEIEQIRGVETSTVLRTLLERKVVRIVGRKEVPGRPILYGTTRLFLQQFGLRELSDLPPLREFKELGDAEQAALPIEEDPLIVSQGSNGNGDSHGHGHDRSGETVSVASSEPDALSDPTGSAQSR